MASAPQQPVPSTTLTLPLNDIQGNLAGFNKDFQRFVFLSFPDEQSGRGLLGDIAEDLATCDQVLEFNDLFKKVNAHPSGEHDVDTGKVEANWTNLALSFAGLQVIGAGGISSFPSEFQAGMRAAAGRLGDVDDSAPAGWVAPFNGTIHAVVLLAADEREDLDRIYGDLQTHIKAHNVEELEHEDGQTRPGAERGHEHFGFKDGISQPAIAGLSLPGADATPKPGQRVIAAGAFLLGQPKDLDPPPIPPPAPAPQPGQPGYPGPTPGPTPPPPDPFPAWAINGSYLVFRRLRQNVEGFNEFVTVLAEQEGVPPAVLEAKLVGRYKSGAPLERTNDQASTLDPSTGDPSAADPSILDDSRINNFGYAADADGALVPRAAHIRKTNPRDQAIPGQQDTDRRRILRRGIPYGPEFAPTEPPYPDSGSPPDPQDRGLLFLCYQASIADQFEFIQSTWVNNDGFPQAGDGRDPIISQDVAAPEFTLTPQNAHLMLRRWVITTGGEYFFSPSVSAVRALAAGSAS
jgi:Dyp-type peroxidase family